jgi:DbpA RNA binding domain
VTVADAKAALERGRPIVLVRAPAVEQAADLWALIAGDVPAGSAGSAPTVLVCADAEAAAEWAGAAPTGLRVHAVTGLARSARVLKAGAVDVLAGAAPDLAALAQRAALKLDPVATVVLAWPEAVVGSEAAPALDTILAEAKDARRIVLSWNPAVLGDFLERHARRALVIGALPVDDAGAPLGPVCQVRYAIVPAARRAAACRDALDVLGATHPLVWDGGPIDAPAASGSAPDAVLCTRLPTRADLAALARSGTPVVFITARQLPYLRSIAAATPLALPSGADRARDRGAALRERVAARLAAGNVDAELALLDPLFEQFDPAEVAAALLAVLGSRASEASGPVAEASPAARVKLFVTIGKKDRAAAKDLVGALLREVGLAKGDLGRVEVRETFSLVEVAAPVAAQAARRLSGVTIRGRRVLARLDREA